MNKLKENRLKVRALGFKIYTNILISKLMAWIYSRANMEVYWIMKQEEGYMLINLTTLDRLNKLKKITRGNKIHVRDLDKGCIYRTPKRTWGKLKIVSK